MPHDLARPVDVGKDAKPQGHKWEATVTSILHVVHIVHTYIHTILQWALILTSVDSNHFTAAVEGPADHGRTTLVRLNSWNILAILS